MTTEKTSATEPDEHWEIYVTFVDDKIAVIMVDLAVADLVPIAEKPSLVWLWVKIASPDEDGLATEEEELILNEIEDALTDALDSQMAKYVGRITTDGRREFYFYTDAPQQFCEVATSVMNSFPGYGIEVDQTDDEGWSHYKNVLFPSAEDFQQIRNQQMMSRLVQAGDVLGNPRPVDHYANFRSHESRELFIREAEGLEFEAASRPERQENSEFPFAVGLIRVHSVDPETIDQITFEVFDLVNKHEGEYEGWGTKPSP